MIMTALKSTMQGRGQAGRRSDVTEEWAERKREGERDKFSKVGDN